LLACLRDDRSEGDVALEEHDGPLTRSASETLSRASSLCPLGMAQTMLPYMNGTFSKCSCMTGMAATGDLGLLAQNYTSAGASFASN
jgi:hypothetical protein